MELYSTCYFESHFFHLIQCIWNSSIVVGLYISVISFYCWVIFYFIYVPFPCWERFDLPTINICIHRFLSNLRKYQMVGLLGHIIKICLTVWETEKLFYKVSVPLYISTINEWKFMFIYPEALKASPSPLTFQLSELINS